MYLFSWQSPVMDGKYKAIHCIELPFVFDNIVFIHILFRLLKIALIFGSIAAFAMPITGDIAAKDVAERQPAKLAAMEAHYHTG